VGQFHKVAVSGEVAVMPETRFAEALISKSSHISSDLLLVPWGETGSLGDAQIISSENANGKLAPSYTNFVNSILQSAEHNIAVFFSNSNKSTVPDNNQSLERAKLMRTYSLSDMNRDIPIIPATNKSHHIFLPYFGDKDDKLALMITLQLCEKSNVTASVMHISASTDAHDEYFVFASTHVPAEVKPRVKFETVPASTTVEEILDRAASETQAETRETHTLIVLGRRAGVRPAEGKVAHTIAEEIKECLGDIAGNLIASGVKADLLVVQSKVSTSRQFGVS